jgi:AraC-like DNA-binding protein
VTTSEPGISEEVVGPCRRALEELGFDTSTVGAQPVGLIVPGSAADALFEQAAAFLHDEALACTLAARIPIGSLGVIDYGLCTAPTLHDALTTITRFYGVATQRARLELVEDGPSARLVFHRQPGIEHSRHWVEFAFAMIGTRIRQTIGRERMPFTRVSFVHAAPHDPRAHDEFFGTRVAFGAAEEWLAFPSEILTIPLQTASRALAELLERRMRELEPAMAPTDPVLDRVRRTLAAMLDDGETDIVTLAKRLGESKRTLQRMLSERQTSHTALLDELRRQRAKALLDAGLRVAEVAKRLGFSEPSAFFRAYRRWTGTSPKGEKPDEPERADDDAAE